MTEGSDSDLLLVHWVAAANPGIGMALLAIGLGVLLLGCLRLARHQSARRWLATGTLVALIGYVWWDCRYLNVLGALASAPPDQIRNECRQLFEQKASSSAKTDDAMILTNSGRLPASIRSLGTEAVFVNSDRILIFLPTAQVKFPPTWGVLYTRTPAAAEDVDFDTLRPTGFTGFYYLYANGVSLRNP